MNLEALHDSNLLGISVGRDKRGQLLFEMADGRRATLVLEKVEHFLANDFRQGNIVLDVTIQKGEDYESNYLAQLFGKEYLEKNKAFQESLVAKIVSGKLNLVAVEPSYGCTLIALCESCSYIES